jgi:hypothetical protein
VPREAIRAPLAHVLAEMPRAKDIIPCVADGDVVLVTSGKIVPWVQTADGLRPACGDTASLGRRRCEYEDSVRLAEEAMGLAPGSLFELDQSASPFDDSRYSGKPFSGWTRREIEQQWGRPPGSMRAFDYGTKSHLDRLASEIARLEFPSPPPAGTPARSATPGSRANRPIRYPVHESGSLVGPMVSAPVARATVGGADRCRERAGGGLGAGEYGLVRISDLYQPTDHCLRKIPRSGGCDLMLAALLSALTAVCCICCNMRGTANGRSRRSWSR